MRGKPEKLSVFFSSNSKLQSDCDINRFNLFDSILQRPRTDSPPPPSTKIDFQLKYCPNSPIPLYDPTQMDIFRFGASLKNGYFIQSYWKRTRKYDSENLYKICDGKTCQPNKMFDKKPLNEGTLNCFWVKFSNLNLDESCKVCVTYKWHTLIFYSQYSMKCVQLVVEWQTSNT